MGYGVIFWRGHYNIITGIGWIAYRVVKHQGQLDHIDDKFQDIKDRIGRLESYFDIKINTKIKEAESPLSLTPYAQALLEEIGFDPLFDEIKDKLAEEIEKRQLRTRYDVQEMADLIVRKMRNDAIFDKLKSAVYEKGQRWEEVIAAISIPLRDYYLSIHIVLKTFVYSQCSLSFSRVQAVFPSYSKKLTLLRLTLNLNKI